MVSTDLMIWFAAKFDLLPQLQSDGTSMSRHSCLERVRYHAEGPVLRRGCHSGALTLEILLLLGTGPYVD